MCKVFCIDPACCIRSNPCEKKTRFYEGRSLTYVVTGGRWEVKNFMDGSVAGFFGNDTMQLGSSFYSDGELVVPGTIFGQALRIPKSFANASSFACSVIQRADQNTIENGGQENVDGGLVTYGGLDSNNCDSVIVYEPLIEPAYWQFKLSAVSSTNFKQEDEWPVISDTSSALIVAPLTIAASLALIFGAQRSTACFDLRISCDGQSVRTLCRQALLTDPEYSFPKLNYCTWGDLRTLYGHILY
ncbi:hypothetical protein ANCDUO_00904 [Ancylostoma duodenale]|uniref:Peptidase A1 domain-containing protein n=1 Tax=Ancylostoma duodenale TaxID=51022 RepID=A0A0C2HGK2_9BILA|nr:hypothetical protein ANCDUO_00904 [Ancylostoma duodenale]